MHTVSNTTEFGRYQVTSEADGLTVLDILRSKLNLSRKLIRKLKRTGGIRVNDEESYTNRLVVTGDIVRALICDEESTVTPVPIPIDIVYEDDAILILNKPGNMVVHPVRNHQFDTLANGVAHYLLQQGLKQQIRPVHRLDRETSGLIVFAKNQLIHKDLSLQLRSGQFKRAYLAIVHGVLSEASGTIDLPIARSNTESLVRVICPQGQRAVTHYKALKPLNRGALVHLQLDTGRTHQIRVHMSHIGHPLFGDFLYGKTEPELIERQALHSAMISFLHPVTLEHMNVALDMPQDMQILAQKLS
jgi:23S rRNA pseudouridine1911/1915/1917 synthase